MAWGVPEYCSVASVITAIAAVWVSKRSADAAEATYDFQRSLESRTQPDLRIWLDKLTEASFTLSAVNVGKRVFMARSFKAISAEGDNTQYKVYRTDCNTPHIVQNISIREGEVIQFMAMKTPVSQIRKFQLVVEYFDGSERIVPISNESNGPYFVPQSKSEEFLSSICM